MEKSQWVSQVGRRPGWHPQDRRPHRTPHIQQFNVRGRYKGTYVVNPTPQARTTAWPSEPTPSTTQRDASPGSPEWDSLLQGINMDDKRQQHAFTKWKMRASLRRVALGLRFRRNRPSCAKLKALSASAKRKATA